jgi:PAS domain S-box-containing protein
MQKPPVGDSLLFRQLQQLQAQYQAVTDTMHEAVYLVDLDGRLVFANPALTWLTHYSLDALLGQPSTMLFTPETTPKILERRRAILQGEGITLYRQRQMLRKDGQQVDVEVSTLGLSIAGRIAGFVVVIRDLTDRLQLETQLRQSQKMQALGTLVGGIAHDFNNILAAVLGYAELIGDQVPQDSGARAHLHQILVAGERAR